MNKVINVFLLAVNTFMFELHLRQPGFIYSTSGPFTKHCKRIQKFVETGNLNYIRAN